ncbi:PREDICTED: probable E3 ubiquitin-protein ligase RHG1A [Lupinus angustifolius]|uniref:probable E3 ubiquitin-protein ligase RHG1A n=1 Tax=Lupinus angustifolius TaxID=3871 RepID=UPI00092F73BC|nr:PREDICTED: probable E3 ubiquitin-protein ligase RHG1A [Lupinus angustifolius]XP_019437962.1 PREDICTED: probable E3 ubiquitin-protein ligase RHG1A [Lupinus angustifolius]
MQGQRGAVGSMPETFEFDCGSTSSNPTMDQQTCWNNVRSNAENQIPEYMLSPSDINSVYVNSINHEWQNLSGWSFGEPSSGNTANEINNNEQNRELQWSSSINVGVLSGPRLEERCLEPTNALLLDNIITGPTHMHSSNSHPISENLNLNSGIADSGSDNSQQLDHHNLHKSSRSVNEHTPPSIGSGSFLIPTENNGFLVEDTDGRPGCSLDTRRVPCKRKAVEGSDGQSSDSGSSSYTQHGDGSAWHPLPTQDNARSSLSRAISAEQLNARLGLGIGDEASESIPNSNVAGNSESLYRNFRLRINPSNPQSSTPPTAFSTGSVIRHSGAFSFSSTPQRFHPVDNSSNLRSAPPIDNMIPTSQPPIIHVPALPRNRQSYRWSGGSSSRSIQSLNSIICPDRDNLPQEGASSGSMSRNTLEHPVFVPASNLRNLVQNPAIRGSSSANLSIPGNVASSSRTALNAATNPSSASTWASRPNPSEHPRRLAEYVRRSLFPPGSEATGGPSNNHSSLQSGPSASESRALSSGAHPRSALWLERQGDSDLGIPHSLRTLAVASEGSSRIVSELRNVLGLMRRGGNLRFEDVMILDQSVLSGMADIHDRHRDMRLDVDNMSYEELLALEERIGNVSTGLSEETILKLLKHKKYVAETGSEIDAEPCCVCQENYVDGDDIGTLNCRHDFHSNCIKQWLMHKNLCPVCKTTGLAT